ncbi:MAG: hypothetical protein JO327_09830 [Nitrososphaeraceae archaeon]|nr:hypothetical protein [Nitrososphaeraceae archaeon]MBV9668414.1 hypothetical protein [Nitrososphaeraceae archaeon]
MNNKIKKINNSNDYEKSSFKDIIQDMEDTKNVGLKSVPKIRREQVPSADETSKEILYGDGDSDEDNNK